MLLYFSLFVVSHIVGGNVLHVFPVVLVFFLV